MHLKEIEVERFMAAVLAGEFRLLRHLDISNREGLACEGDLSNRCYNASFIPIQQLLEQRPDFCLVAEFPKGSSLFQGMFLWMNATHLCHLSRQQSGKSNAPF